MKTNFVLCKYELDIDVITENCSYDVGNSYN